MTYIVEVVERKTGNVVKRIDCGSSERRANTVDNGVNRNMNHADFYTRIVEEEVEKVTP